LSVLACGAVEVAAAAFSAPRAFEPVAGELGKPGVFFNVSLIFTALSSSGWSALPRHTSLLRQTAAKL
jgi:hypothetical protein